MAERLPPLPEPLGPEERALAARLARLGPHGEPSPALDARILAAARAGLADPAAPSRQAARWPWAFGIAASVALAVGLAWQLRPLPEAVTYDEAAVAVAARAQAADTQAADAVAAVPPATPAPPEPAPAAATQAPVAFRQAAAPDHDTTTGKTRVADAPAGNAAAAPRRERAQPAPAPIALPAPPVVEEPEAEAAVVVDSALPAPPPAPPAPQAAKAAAPAPSQAAAREAAARRAQAAAAAAESRAADTRAIETHAAETRAAEAAARDSFADEPFVEDIPPATADSPAVRDAWLYRIRELQAAGDTEAARASLQEFARRYPAFPLPEDLRPLLDPDKAPAP